MDFEQNRNKAPKSTDYLRVKLLGNCALGVRTRGLHNYPTKRR